VLGRLLRCRWGYTCVRLLMQVPPAIAAVVDLCVGAGACCCCCSSGIPLFFPQWREGLLPEMGFADKLKWEVVATVRRPGCCALGSRLHSAVVSCCVWRTTVCVDME
jgi:hypothetical protein